MLKKKTGSQDLVFTRGCLDPPLWLHMFPPKAHLGCTLFIHPSSYLLSDSHSLHNFCAQHHARCCRGRGDRSDAGPWCSWDVTPGTETEKESQPNTHNVGGRLGGPWGPLMGEMTSLLGVVEGHGPRGWVPFESWPYRPMEYCMLRAQAEAGRCADCAGHNKLTVTEHLL